MTELPIVVNMTVDASRTEYDLTAESNLEEIELLNDTVIETGGSHVPVYEGPYTVDAGLNAVTLDTDGKRMTQDVTVNALTENSVSMTDFTVAANTGIAAITSTVTRGYSPTAKSATNTVQLPTQARATITPTASEQTAVAKGKYTTGVVKVRAIPTGTRGTPTATKGTVSNHSVSVTPSVTNTTGYITGGTINGTAVSVSASELVSGDKAITRNGNNIDVVNYSTVSVNVPTVTPTGTYNISANGTYDITNYKYVEVEVIELTEQTIATSGAVSQQLDIKTLYHFTGSLTSLTITLTTTTDIAEYHFDFNSGSTAPTLNMPLTVIMPDSFQVEANKHYEVDVLNNYGTVKSWSIS